MNAEVPNAEMVLADPTNYHARPLLQILRGAYDLIVIHVTSGHGDPYGTASMWQRPDNKTSAHFVIGQSGKVLQCVPLRYAAQHAHEANTYSVGVEHCAREPREFGPADPGLPPSSEQYLASAKLVAYLCKAAGLPPTRETIQGHAEADPQTTHSGCPLAAGWNWELYMQLVGDEYRKLENGQAPQIG